MKPASGASAPGAFVERRHMMIVKFERFAWDHPTAAGIVAMAVMVAIFGIVGGIERGTIQLPI